MHVRRLLPVAAIGAGLVYMARAFWQAADWSRHLTDPYGAEVLEFPTRPRPEPDYPSDRDAQIRLAAEMTDLAARDAARQGGKR